MPFVVPKFNLKCNVVASLELVQPPSNPGATPYRLTGQPCALVFGQRVNVAGTGGTGLAGIPLLTMSLLLPIGTDVRGPQSISGKTDLVEVPAGTGRWYWVAFVDDIGKGWPNEHRTAALLALRGVWPDPAP